MVRLPKFDGYIELVLNFPIRTTTTVIASRAKKV